MAAFGRFRSWPITAARALEPQLRDMGLKIAANAIDGTTGSNGGKPALSDALVSVGPAGRGGTGSFVSDDGLIITNWHVAHDAVRQASLAAGRDFLEEGFVARKHSEEVPGPEYEVWITRSCVDVSGEVLEVVRRESDPLRRANAVRDCTQAIAARAEAEANAKDAQVSGLRCDVQEMFPNESYVLFTQERLLDVRIVYVPPRALGNFGGDQDNFEWPRHTADFTLLRAYIKPDGTAAAYSTANVPYRPTTRLRVCREGAQEGDFVMLLGFPGQTMRYAPTARLQYSDEVAVPWMIRDFARKLALIAQHETHSPEAKLKLVGAKKTLANEFKRSAGKRLMMRKLGLLRERAAEEEALGAAAPQAGPLLARVGEIYAALSEGAELDHALQSLRGVYMGSALLAAGHAVYEWSVEGAKPDGEREASYRERNLPFLRQRLAKRLSEIHQPMECALIADVVAAARSTSASLVAEDAAAAGALRSAADLLSAQAVEALAAGSALLSSFAKEKQHDSPQQGLSGVGGELLLPSPLLAELLLRDAFVQAAAALYDTYVRVREGSKKLLSERDQLFSKLMDLQRAQSQEAFYPDCNGSLRFSAGHVEGYRPTDAVMHLPHTTLLGLLDKASEAAILDASAGATGAAGAGEVACGGGEVAGGVACGGGGSEFECPPRLLERLIRDPEARATRVCVLYSTDTVGGNSGSPVLNAEGEFVAINFDRQRQGLMNEFKWSREYSRSIGVDVRYILWLVGDYDGAAGLVDEMLASSRANSS